MRDLINRMSTREFWSDFGLLFCVAVSIIVVVSGHLSV